MKKIVAVLIFIGMCTFSLTSLANAKPTPLPADQAFVLNITVNGAKDIFAEWQIAPGYFLYSKKIHFQFDPAVPFDVRMPQGELRYDHGKKYEAFSGSIGVPVMLKSAAQTVKLKVSYQGCSQFGFCYPPLEKNVTVDFPNQTVTFNSSSMGMPRSLDSFQTLLTDQNGIHDLLKTQQVSVLLLVFVVIGLLLAFTPCVLPMIPILTSIIVGQKQSTNTQRAFFLSLTYVLGTSVTYSIAGLLAAMMGNSLQVWLQKPAIIGMTSLLFFILALSLFGLYEMRLPYRSQNYFANLTNKQKGGTYAGVFFMGMLSTLIISPCVTAPLIGVLLYISETGNLMFGASALFAMGMGMGIPLMLIGVSAGKYLPKSGPWMEVVKCLFGVLMLGMAIWLLSRIVSDTVTMALSGLLLMLLAGLFVFYLPKLIGKKAMNRGLGLLVGCSGMLLMIGGMEMPNLINHWSNLNSVAPASSFIIVRDIDALNKQFSAAVKEKRPVLLDFYADWCESCVSMDKHVFDSSNVKQVLNNYILLRADLTENTEASAVLLKQFKVIAPPTILFFDSKGKEINAHRIVGEVDAKEFLNKIDVVRSKVCHEKVNC